MAFNIFIQNPLPRLYPLSLVMLTLPVSLCIPGVTGPVSFKHGQGEGDKSAPSGAIPWQERDVHGGLSSSSLLGYPRGIFISLLPITTSIPPCHQHWWRSTRPSASDDQNHIYQVTVSAQALEHWEV